MSQIPRRPRRLTRLFGRLLLGIGAAAAVLLIAIQIHPPLVPAAVDLVRRTFGPEVMAVIQTQVFRLNTMWREFRVALGDDGPRWTLDTAPPIVEAAMAETPGVTPPPSATPEPSPTPLPARTATPLPTTTPTATPLPPTATPLPPTPTPFTRNANWPPPPLPTVIADGRLPGEGQWAPLPALGDGVGPSRMYVTALRPVAARPDIQVALVAIDMTRAQLHLVAGSEEPEITGTVRLDLPRPGVVAAEDVTAGRLLAGFNGAFKSINGWFGMGAHGVTYVQPRDQRATVAIYADNSVRIGLWNREIAAMPDLVAWRQNGHLLVDGGAVTARAREGGLGWGMTVDLQAETWRSGIGLSADAETLFYAVGDGLTAELLAEALAQVGAETAMQLDINAFWARFVTFQRNADGAIVARRLISAMADEPRKYLVRDRREFFYLTAREGP